MNKLQNYLKFAVFGLLIIFGIYVLVSTIFEIANSAKTVDFSISTTALAEIKIYYYYVASMALMGILGTLMAVFSWKLFRGEADSYGLLMTSIVAFWLVHIVNPNGFTDHTSAIIFSFLAFIYFLTKRKALTEKQELPAAI